jgi:nondiscriminating aspartyl-tRNA synthetase
VRLAGWLHRWRRHRRVGFLVLRDGRGLAQIVVEDPALLARLDGLAHESVLEVAGEAVAAAQAPGGVEVHRPTVTVLAEAEPPPFDLFRPELAAQLPTALDHAAVALRHARPRAIFALGAAAVAGFRAALDAQGFVEVQTPKLVAAATESGANVFPVDYFGRTAYLAQSPQLYKQIMVGVFERVYEVGPVFRAEPHDTPRHLNAYVSLDAELGFVRDHRDVMAAARDAVAGMLGAIAARAPDAPARLDLALPDLPAAIPAVDFADALALVGAATGEDLSSEPDLAPAHERWLGAWARREHGSDFLFVTGYPLAKRPFYTHPDPDRPGASNGFDLLFRGLELATGGQRLHRHADYLAALAARGLDPVPLEGYLEAFRHGMPPHGGFAIGLERFVARLVGADNVRETTLFPRDRHRLTP